MSLRIVTPGLQTTVQDLGRAGYQRDAVPRGGAMDRQAARIANLLVGNPDCAAVIEAALIGPAIVFENDSLIAITGGDLESSIDHESVPNWHSIHVKRGATLRFGRVHTGCRTYVAVAGGIDVPAVFGSRSTYLRGAFGGYKGRAFRPADILPTGAIAPLSNCITKRIRAHSTRTAAVARWSIGITLRPRYSDDVRVRVTAGAHLDLLSADARESFLGATFRVSSSSDRMGYRLDGKALTLREPAELLSEGVTFGTIQLPPGGAPIILMADAQTAGGYPRLAEVASVDLPLVAQLKPGDRIRFRLVTVDEAQAELALVEEEIAQAKAAIALQHAFRT